MAVSISGVAGTISHGESITISGYGFGTKATAAPTLWDNCSGTDPLALWTNGDPTTNHGETNEAYNFAYRTPTALGRGVALPHPHITKYLCAAHYSSVTDGANVVIWKTVATSPPCYTYVSWYRRIDPNWVWGTYDQNFKDACWSDTLTEGPYSDNNYLSHHDGSFYEYYTGYWDANVFSGYVVALEHERLETKWVKTEWETYWSNTGGWMKVWEDGVLKMHYSGDTLIDDGPNTIAIEGFFREVSTENWRYMADIYLDHTIQRVLIGNASTLAACTTLREVQIPTAWSNTSITVTINQGGFADSSTAYLYVFDNNGYSNSSGFEITFGTSETYDTTPDQFTFTDVTNATRSTVYTSNQITVSSIDTVVGVAISNGTYSKNGAAYTSEYGTCVNGDTFTVRHTSSSSYSTATNTVLSIGGITDTYTTTTLADPSIPEEPEEPVVEEEMGSWPATLPQELIEDNFEETMQSIIISTDMEVGPPKTRKRLTANYTPIKGSIIVTKDQRAIFNTFFHSTIAGGAIKFTWEHPITGTSVKMKIIGQPKITPLGGDYFKIDMDFHILPTLTVISGA